MLSLQVLYQLRAVIHLLVMCLILETAYGQDNRNNLFSANIKISPIKNANEFTVDVMVTNNVDKCMAVKVSTEDNPNIKYLSAHAAYTTCICNTNTFFWDIKAYANAVLRAKVEVVPAKGICPEGEKIHSVTNYLKIVSYQISVTP